MWKRAHSSGDLTAEVQRSQEEQYANHIDAVRSIFNTTRCYDLMQVSCKVVVFETDIPFQLAFYALAEQEADIAPLWDPRLKRFVAMMTSTDFLQALWMYHQSPTKSMNDLKYKSILEMLEDSEFSFKHNTFQSVDAEDSAYQMCRVLQRQTGDYVPVTDPDEGSLVAILGYLDIVNLLNTAATQFPHLFETTIEEAGIGTYRVITANGTTPLGDVLQTLEEKHISSIPITNDQGQVTSLYYKGDVSFISKSADPDALLANIANISVQEAISGVIGGKEGHTMIDGAVDQSGPAVASPSPNFRTCRPQDSIKDVVLNMMTGRVTRCVVVDATGVCLGIVSIKDIVLYYLQ